MRPDHHSDVRGHPGTPEILMLPLLLSIVHGTEMQDRDGGVLPMSVMFGLFPFLLKLYADSGYQGPQFRNGMKCVYEQINVEIVKRCDVGKFVVLPKRRIVERTIAWLNRYRRLAKDLEYLNSNGLAFFTLGHNCPAKAL
jgi:hypothetical protein